jgi:hypothetical protein
MRWGRARLYKPVIGHLVKILPLFFRISDFLTVITFTCAKTGKKNPYISLYSFINILKFIISFVSSGFYLQVSGLKFSVHLYGKYKKKDDVLPV